MASTVEQTVTIDRAYFETILRRYNLATLHTDVVSKSANFNPDDAASPVVTVTPSEYNSLKTTATRYDNLCRNLLRGGVGEEALELLAQDDATIEQQQQQVPSSAPARGQTSSTNQTTSFTSQAAFEDRSHLAHSKQKYHNTHPQPYSHGQYSTIDTGRWESGDIQEANEAYSGGREAFDESLHQNSYDNAPIRPHHERQCARSLILSGLADATTHADITDAVRGGQLLDVFVKPQDRTATVSFVESADAQAFLNHVHRHDLYIKQKRVEIRWSDRHFILPNHVANNIGNGATRNLVIRRCDPRLTEAAIRGDLEHIHNLAVIKVEFLGGSCYIKTNSVHNAMFARTCMMSRAKYKHSKIEWDVDECCQLFQPSAVVLPLKRNGVTKRASVNTTINRFDLLNLDENDSDNSN